MMSLWLHQGRTEAAGALVLLVGQPFWEAQALLLLHAWEAGSQKEGACMGLVMGLAIWAMGHGANSFPSRPIGAHHRRPRSRG